MAKKKATNVISISLDEIIESDKVSDSDDSSKEKQLLGLPIGASVTMIESEDENVEITMIRFPSD